MSLQRLIRAILSLMLALSFALWAESGLAMLAADHGARCHAQMSHMQPHTMPCCPMHVASAPSGFFEPPPCCNLTNQPARSLAFLITSSKPPSIQLSACGTAGAITAPVQRISAFLLVADTPPFVKPIFDKKTDLRI
jgi:hypothetical protein